MRLRFPSVRPQISFRALMVLVALSCLGLGWFSWTVRVQREAVAAVRRFGGGISYECDPQGMTRRDPKTGRMVPGERRSWTPGWLIDRVGIDCFSHPVRVGLPDRGEPADETLRQVGRLGRVHTLIVYAKIRSDDALASLAGLTALRRLELFDANAGDAGLAHLARLRKLRGLALDRSRVTDAGMATVDRFDELERLSLIDSAITDASLARIEGLTKLKQFDLGGTGIDLDGANLKAFQDHAPGLRITHAFGTYGID